MGALGNSMAAFAQPLIDQTDGSIDQMQKAMSIAMLCWNMAILPDGEHDEFLGNMKGEFQMDGEEFRTFRHDVIDPMIRRHRKMFPVMDPTRKQVLRSEGRAAN